MSVESVARFSRALDAYPAAFTGNPLNLLFLEDAYLIASGRAYLRCLDGPTLMEERREYLTRGGTDWPFPRIAVTERPDAWEVSRRLFERFDEAKAVLPDQYDIARFVEARAKATEPDVVLFVIADGLSYYDLPEEMGAQPCLVRGVTTTEYGYRAAVGNPSLSRRLFRIGYQNQMGYTYYTAEEGSLSGDIFATFAPSQLMRFHDLEQVLEHIDVHSSSRSYLQVTLAGLDQICHAHHDRPPREDYLRQLLARFERLVENARGRTRRVLACLTADHGILWREEIETRAEVVDDLFSQETYSPRYIKGHLLRHYGHKVTCFGQRFTLLGVPYLTRRLRANEWGVHGGISAWESLVPLHIIQTG